jgi:hypothetical protein
MSASAASLAAPHEEASDEELHVEASGKVAFDISPTMSIIGECSSSIAQTNRARSSKQNRSSEGEIARAKTTAAVK